MKGVARMLTAPRERLVGWYLVLLGLTFWAVLTAGLWMLWPATVCQDHWLSTEARLEALERQCDPATVEDWP